MRLRQVGEKRWCLIINSFLGTIEIPVKEKLTKVLIPLFGCEVILSSPNPVNLFFIESKKLRSCLEQDEFGVYKKEGIEIPFKYKREYEKLKNSREYHIYKRYCGLSRFAIYKRKDESYMDYVIHKTSKDVIDEIQNLLSKG